MSSRIIHVGISTLGLASNIAYAQMRAQNDPKNNTKRIVTFIFGFPTTFLSWYLVEEGSNIAYGINCGPRTT